MVQHVRWTKRTKDRQVRLSADLKQAFEHAEVKMAFGRAVSIFRQWWEHYWELPPSERDFPLTPNAPCMQHWHRLIQQHAPGVAEVYGANLHKFLLRGIFWALRIPWPDSWEPKLERLSPGHPLIFHEDGRFSGLEDMTVEQFYEYRDYERSKAPPGKRGPKKKPTKQRRQGKRSIDPALVLRAAEMAANGCHWAAIAAEIFPKEERYRDDSQRDKL